MAFDGGFVAAMPALKARKIKRKTGISPHPPCEFREFSRFRRFAGGAACSIILWQAKRLAEWPIATFPWRYNAVPHPVQNFAPGGLVFWQFGQGACTTTGAAAGTKPWAGTKPVAGAAACGGVVWTGGTPGGTAAGFQIGIGIPSTAAIPAA